jgi:hypothetical protein
MEPLWSPAVATGGNAWQMRTPGKRLKEAKTVAVGCDQLPEVFMVRVPSAPLATGCGRPLSVKEGVDFLAPQNGKSCEPEGPQDLTARL